MVTDVIFDDGIFSSQRHGGISRYITELICALERIPNSGVKLSYPTFAKTSAAIEAGLSRPIPFSALARRPIITTANYFSERTKNSRRRDSAHILHHTFYRESYLRRFPNPKARVTTLYDFIPELFGSPASPNAHFAKDRFIQNSDALICISAATAADLNRLYGDVGVPVYTIPLGVNPAFAAARMRASRLFEFDYVLFVGSRDGYKSFDVALQAMSRLMRKDIHLVAVGSPATQHEQSVIAKLKLTDRVHFASLVDNQLITAYQQAKLFVFPSSYEGFGLPVLEAMACGCPVVISDTDALMEVGQSVARDFRSGDADSLADAMASVIDDPATSAAMIEQGRKRASEYTWEKTALATLECYQTL